jgi:hypothetical protein
MMSLAYLMHTQLQDHLRRADKSGVATINRALAASIALFAFAANMSASDYYKLTNVKRLETNLYKADGNLLIETTLCLHLSVGEDAVLKWNGAYSGDNKIIWDDGDSCAVSKLLKE